MMKKFLSVLLAAALALSLGVTAMAEGEPPENTGATDSIEITKRFVLTVDGVSSPAAGFDFAVDKTEYRTFTNKVEAVTVPALQNTDGADVTAFHVSYTAGALNGAGASPDDNGNSYVDQKFSFKLPNYSTPGKYLYYIKETVPTTPVASVTYDTIPVIMMVQVSREIDPGTHDPTGKLVREVVFFKGEADTIANKTDFPTFENKFPAKNLSITKVTAGTYANTATPFHIDVTLTAPNSAAIQNDIQIISPNGDKNTVISSSQWESGNTWTGVLQIKNGETWTFKGVPENIKYTVKEQDYTAFGYVTTYKNGDAEVSGDSVTGTMGSDDVSITITNTRNDDGYTDPPTGIALDSLPYIVLLGGVAVGLAIVLVSRKRKHFDD